MFHSIKMNKDAENNVFLRDNFLVKLLDTFFWNRPGNIFNKSKHFSKTK